MTDLSILRANERIKAWSSALFNLGSALAGAAVVRFYDKLAFDLPLIVWSAGAASLIWVAHSILGLLDSEI